MGGVEVAVSVPEAGSPAPTTLAGLILSRAEDETDGLLYEDQRWAWREVVVEARVRADMLVRQRRPGPFHVGVLLENVPEFIFLLLGAGLAGAAIVGINPTRRGAELARDINHTDCQLIIADASMRPLLDEIALDLPPERILDVDGPAWGEALAVAAEAVARGDLDSLAAPDEDTLFALLFTSGSTGAPKAVRMTQGRAARTVADSRFTSSDVLYCAMPLYHGNALNANLFPALRSGAAIALRRRFSASGFLPDAQRYGVTFFNTVGRALNHILSTPATDDDRHHSIKYVLGPETAPADVRAFRKRFGTPVIEGYGSSENAIIMIPDPELPKGSLGRPLDGIDVVILDPVTAEEKPRARYDEHGKLLNAGEAIGELVSRNATSRFEGYYNNPEADAERTRNGWYWSGDLGYRDEASVFWFAGRNADWIRVDGENFAAAPVERILARFPGADGVAAYAVPDSRTGDQVMVAIEMLAGATFDPDAFATFLAEQRDLGTKWAPRYVRVVDALPVGATNKIDKRPLRAERWETTDPLFWRAPRTETYVRFTAADADELRAEFEANDRANLLR
ncbi:MAG: AMP-binding protein [Actinomycetota bacterium]|nr:AMP-binding protein [Actinomycetota bacterium]